MVDGAMTCVLQEHASVLSRRQQSLDLALWAIWRTCGAEENAQQPKRFGVAAKVISGLGLSDRQVDGLTIRREGPFLQSTRRGDPIASWRMIRLMRHLFGSGDQGHASASVRCFRSPSGRDVELIRRARLVSGRLPFGSGSPLAGG